MRSLHILLALNYRCFYTFVLVPELKKYIDHAYTDEMMLSTDSRAEIVLAGPFSD